MSLKNKIKKLFAFEQEESMTIVNYHPKTVPFGCYAVVDPKYGRATKGAHEQVKRDIVELLIEEGALQIFETKRHDGFIEVRAHISATTELR